MTDPCLKAPEEYNISPTVRYTSQMDVGTLTFVMYIFYCLLIVLMESPFQILYKKLISRSMLLKKGIAASVL